MKAGLVTIAAVLASVAMAQSFEEGIADLSLLQNREVQDELGVTEDMRTKMNKFADDFNAKMKVLEEEYQKASEGKPTPPQPPVEKIANLQSGLKKNVFSLLSKSQIKRLSELTLQAAGYPAMLSDTVAKKIGLTSAQLKKLRDGFQRTSTEVNRLQQEALKPIYDKYGKEKPESEEAAKKLQETVNGETKAAMDKIQPKLKTLRDEFLSIVKKTVKAIQMNRFEALQGKPYKPKS
jgi:hypothetical protein